MNATRLALLVKQHIEACDSELEVKTRQIDNTELRIRRVISDRSQFRNALVDLRIFVERFPEESLELFRELACVEQILAIEILDRPADGAFETVILYKPAHWLKERLAALPARHAQDSVQAGK